MPESPESVLTVAELDRRLRRAVEGITGREWVEGEVSAHKCAPSGHVYFTLKDEREDALIDCVMYRMHALRGAKVLSEGARVHVMGRATLWAPRGRLQLVVEKVRPQGRGALLEALAQTQKRLAQEGFFAEDRKRRLPRSPHTIGLVTSRIGAAWRDVVAVALRRGGARIILSPALVQGEGAVDSLIAAIDRIERYPGLDVLIVGRGGGAGEDLMAFNDERLVRRLAKVAVPVVSAVGHDIDTTLSDLVADQRAATPSEAAELVVPDSQKQRTELERATLAMARGIERRLAEDRATHAMLAARLSDPRFSIATHQQSLDELFGRLQASTQHTLRRAKAPLDRHRRLLLARHPRVVIASSRSQAVSLALHLETRVRQRIHASRVQLASFSARLDALSPLAVLARGYAIATRLDGRAIRGPDEIDVGEKFHLRVGRGGLVAEVRTKGDWQRNQVDE